MAEAPPPPDRVVWGMGVCALHDRYWASRRIQVVRRGTCVPIESGPSLYLLVQPDDLVVFDPRTCIRKLQWSRARLGRLRLVLREQSSPYRESVIVGPGGEFRAIRRLYQTGTRSTCRAWLTPDARMARAWADSPTTRVGIDVLRRLAPRDAVVSLSLQAGVFDRRDHAQEDEVARTIMGRWSRVGAVVEGVYELAPGIWLHESASVGARVRMVAPVWIGAGAVLPDDDIVIGPEIVPDRRPLGSAASIDWRAMAIPGWKIVPRLGRRWTRRVTKRAFDIAFSLCVLLATLPLYPLIILAIWREDGRPAFFAHTRQTMRGRPFPCLKFRTMRRDAERIKQEIMASNEVDGPQFFIKNDPRVLKIGALLRRFQLDELPQFINVLLGHMSVVGPRPSPDAENQYCPTWREMRLGVRPGVTGLWQVRRTREPETDFQEWIRYDLEYVQHQSWRLDLWIIVQTIRRMIRG